MTIKMDSILRAKDLKKECQININISNNKEISRDKTKNRNTDLTFTKTIQKSKIMKINQGFHRHKIYQSPNNMAEAKTEETVRAFKDMTQVLTNTKKEVIEIDLIINHLLLLNF